MADAQRARLTVPRERAEQILDTQAEAGTKLHKPVYGQTLDHYSWTEWVKDRDRWIALTTEALRSIYSTSGPADEFRKKAYPPASLAPSTTVQQARAVEAVSKGVNVLHSLKERLDYVLEAQSGGRTGRAHREDEQAAVFIVHGHDDATKTRVARLLERTGPYPVRILHERPELGRALIEKFEQEAVAIRYAVVLLTADDLGKARKEGDEASLRPRARQNVIFELGYFVALLGRRYVAVLRGEDVEIPSDYAGIVFIELDDGGVWEYKLLREMRAAGLEDYDLNALS